MCAEYTSSSSKDGSPKSVRRQYDYIDNKSISPLLLCCICKDPFVDPVTDKNNRHGCRSCFTSTDGPFTDITEAIVVGILHSLLVRCTLCEQTNIRRDALDKHQQTVCPQAVISCKAADIKCPWKGRREQLDQHFAGCVFQPLRPALAEIITENRELREKIEQLERLVRGQK